MPPKKNLKNLENYDASELLTEILRRSGPPVPELGDLPLTRLTLELSRRLADPSRFSLRDSDDHINYAPGGPLGEPWLRKHLQVGPLEPLPTDYGKALAADQECVAIVFDVRDLKRIGGGYTSPLTFKSRYNLAVKYAFDSEVVLADAFSAFLGSPRRIVTARHCVDQADRLPHLRVWFDYTARRASETPFVIRDEELYEFDPKIYISRKEEDWVVLELTRAVEGRRIPKIGDSATLHRGAPLHTIGHPRGLPRKVGGAGVFRANRDAVVFQAAFDGFRGESGAPVFDATTHEVVGIYTDGPLDMEGRMLVKCLLGCADDDCVRATAFVDYLK